MKYKELIKLGGIWFLLFVFMGATMPYNMPVFLLIVPFVLLGIALFTTWQVLSRAYYLHIGKTQTRQSKLLGVVISLVAVLSLGLESIGELTPRDFFTLLIFGIVGYFYTVRSSYRE
ncbi:hypothetical protein IPL85_03045 [Candidatus Saccharibacteria bacterium]|nr:MAG: hypothetical protein IPL85_03045 [Candidatus Saccharibacteria bacterium]